MSLFSLLWLTHTYSSEPRPVVTNSRKPNRTRNSMCASIVIFNFIIKSLVRYVFSLDCVHWQIDINYLYLYAYYLEDCLVPSWCSIKVCANEHVDKSSKDEFGDRVSMEFKHLSSSLPQLDIFLCPVKSQENPQSGFLSRHFPPPWALTVPAFHPGPSLYLEPSPDGPLHGGGLLGWSPSQVPRPVLHTLGVGWAKQRIFPASVSYKVITNPEVSSLGPATLPPSLPSTHLRYVQQVISRCTQVI